MSEDEITTHVRGFAIDTLARYIEPKHRFLVEKSPNHIFHVDVIRRVFPQARFIHVIRDGRDVVVSVRAATKSWMPIWKTVFGTSIKTQAESWRNTITRSRQVAALLGEDYYEIRYEELHQHPRTGYRRLFDFAGIPYDDELLETIFQATDFKKNYSGGEDKFRRGGRVADWRTHLTLLASLQFNAVAGQTLIELGYEKNRFWVAGIR